MKTNQNIFVSFIPLLFMCAILAVVSFFVAKKKGYNEFLFFILGLVPMVNAFTAFYLVAAPDLVLHSKVDRLLTELERMKSSGPTTS